MIDFIKCFWKVYRAEISRVTCFDILINNFTNGLYGVTTSNYDRHCHLVFMSQLLAYVQQTRLLFILVKW